MAPPPESGMFCGLPVASTLTVRVPLRVPSAVGVNVTSISQLVRGAKLPGQSFVSAKSPVMATPVIVSWSLPLLVRITVCAPLVVPCVWLGKFRAVGQTTAAGAVIAAPESCREFAPEAFDRKPRVP